MDSATTNELARVLNHIHRTGDLEAYLADPAVLNAYSSFAEYFESLPAVQEIEKSELVRRSGIERTYCYQILSGRRRPGRNRILSLSLAAHLTLKEVQRGLEIAKEPLLYARDQRDAIIIFAVNKGFGVNETEELLTQFGEAGLE